LALLISLAACSGGQDETSRLAELRSQLDGAPVCALLIAPEWPIEASMSALDQPGVDALIAAGLIRREPVVDRANVTPQARITMTAAGRQSLRLYRMSASSSPTPQLCFGKKQVTAIARGDDGPVRYRYRVIDAPDWTWRSDIRAAFPFVSHMLDQEQQAEVGVLEKDGRWEAPGGVEQAGVMEMGDKGFLPCPVEAAPSGQGACE
jgi:hypothetical protein